MGAGLPANAAPNNSNSTELYIVQLAGAPLASYAGGVSGYAATKPAPGKRFAAHSPQSNAYSNLLKSRQDAVLRSSGISENQVVYKFATSFDGIAVRLTAAQLRTINSNSNVVNVFKNRIVSTKTPPTPAFLGLTGNNGVWKKQFGGEANAGAGVIVADLDTGFWPESPSFAAYPKTPKDQAVIDAKWKGTCDVGVDHPITCNNKVIGARWFNATGGAELNPLEYHSPRDFDGHGSHTASTAAGQYVKTTSVNGISTGDLSGVAPGARLAIYKVLYEKADGSGGTGSSTDIVAAVDAAVADGADVISYSIGDDVDDFGAEELAFMQAAQAGVFVSAAGGNAGPGASTIDNAMPWETTVAAGTFDKVWNKTITLGNGKTYTGVGVGAAVANKPLIDSAAAAGAGQTVPNATICLAGSLDPAKVTGKIVLCQRGVNDRVAKSATVKAAGGVGMILWNPTSNSLNADFLHAVPTAHIDTPTGTAIKAYAATANPIASLSAGTQATTEAPTVAGFSSRGPALSSGGGLLKPDVMAPGVDVVAAVSPSNHGGNLYDAESGTSMATPHISGVAALIKSKHPAWSPMWIKSAILTGATPTDNKGLPIQGVAGNATPFEMGAGEVVPAASFDPGLVYDSDIENWVQYACGIGVHLATGDGGDVCDITGSVEPTDLNYPSIAVGSLAGKRTTSRVVTNTTGKTGFYWPVIKAPAGYSVSVSPKLLVVPAHGNAKYNVILTRTNAAFGEYGFGSLTWTDYRGHSVRSTIAAQAVPLSVTDETEGTGTSGSTALKPVAGYTGTLTSTAYGLVRATVTSASLVTDTAGFDPSDPAAGPGTLQYDVSVPDGSKLARVSTFGSDYAAGTDVDLFVYANTPDGLVLAGQSASGSATETVTLTEPGDYTVFVDLFANPAGASSPLTVNSNHWVVGATNAGNFTATPASQSVTLAKASTVTLGWSGLTAGGHYLGVVEYGDGTNIVGQTVLAVAS
jgi:subtilisin family serine protease